MKYHQINFTINQVFDLLYLWRFSAICTDTVFFRPHLPHLIICLHLNTILLMFNFSENLWMLDWRCSFSCLPMPIWMHLKWEKKWTIVKLSKSIRGVEEEPSLFNQLISARSWRSIGLKMISEDLK